MTELRHLRYFTAVVQWKGYREASRHLYVAQPSISEAVSDLESELGIELTPAPTPLGAYVESVQTGTMLHLSGILPAIGHVPKFVGPLGREYNVEQGREAARIAALNVLSVASPSPAFREG